MKFEENEPLVWVCGSFCNPRKVACKFVKLSKNPEKGVIKIASPLIGEMKRIVMLSNLIKAKESNDVLRRN